ncbi:MAG: SPOR domain-containing protein [Pseudomonadota bacterium]
MRAKLFLAAALIGVAAPALADTKAGVDAWERGDYRKAVDEWRAAANTGDADAQFNLGQAYKLGRGVPIDTAQAEGWYQKAAAQGHVQAADNYGLALFQNGRPRDAIPYLERSVARGEPRAQYILGTMLFNGTDIQKDWPRAYALMTRSSAAGLPQAAQTLQQMDGFIAAPQREQGRLLARQMEQGTAGQQLPADLAGARTGMRGVELPPSRVGDRPPSADPIRRIPPVVRTPAPPIVRPALPVQQAAASGRWRVQLGAFGEPGNARKLWGQVAGRFAGRSPDYVKAGALTKLLVGPFGSRAEAAAACGAVKPCVPVGP